MRKTIKKVKAGNSIKNIHAAKKVTVYFAASSRKTNNSNTITSLTSAVALVIKIHLPVASMIKSRIHQKLEKYTPRIPKIKKTIGSTFSKDELFIY